MAPDLSNPAYRHTLPFVKDAKAYAMHRAVVDYIHSPAYDFELPPLSQHSWTQLGVDEAQRERLEFLGDSHMHAFVARELCNMHPNETPHFYTRTRMVLEANSTYAHLLATLGLFDLRDPVKPAGDAFESLLGKYYAEYGEDRFIAYARHYFRPLMKVVGHAYHEFRRSSLQVRRKQRNSANIQKYLSIRPHAKDRRRGHFGTPRSISNSVTKPGTSALKAKPGLFIDLTTENEVVPEIFPISFQEPALRQRPHTRRPIASDSLPSLKGLQEANVSDTPTAAEESSSDQSQRLLQSISTSPSVQKALGSRPSIDLRTPSPSSSTSTAGDDESVPLGNPVPFERSTYSSPDSHMTGAGTSENPFVVY